MSNKGQTGRPYEPLDGQVFGRLTVLREAELRKGHRRYLCLCSCGQEVVVEASHLKSGHTKSCGCYRREKPVERRLDLTGQRYGRLLVLEPAKERRTGSSILYWRCECDCGNICVVHKESLRAGMTKSCGCLQMEQRKANMAKAIHFVEGTCLERIASKKPAANNTSGRRGVYRRANNHWRASIHFQGKTYNLGTYERYEEAVAAREEAEKRLYAPLLARYQMAAEKRD